MRAAQLRLAFQVIAQCARLYAEVGGERINPLALAVQKLAGVLQQLGRRCDHSRMRHGVTPGYAPRLAARMYPILADGPSSGTASRYDGSGRLAPPVPFRPLGNKAWLEYADAQGGGGLGRPRLGRG